MSDAAQVTWDSAPQTPPAQAVKWDDEAPKFSEASLVQNRPRQVAPLPVPATLGRPAMPGVSSRYAGPQSVALTPQMRASREEMLTQPAKGISELAHGNIRPGVSDLIEGGGKLAFPLGAMTAPFEIGPTIAATVTGTAAQKGTQYLAPKLGASPETTRMLSDVAGAAGGVAGAKLTPENIEAAAPFIKSAVSPASTKAAAQFYERGVAPGGLSAEDQQVMRENFNRAAKYIAPETRGYPVAKGEGGAMRTAQIAHRAADNLWQGTVEPVADLFKDVQRPGDEIAGAIRNSFTDLDKQTRGAAVAAGDKLAQFFDGRPVSVGEMKDLITQLNNDRAVSRFYQMSPNEQVASELGDPSLRGKVAALSKLRESMFDAVGESGGEQLGNQFREARKDWGALRSIEDQIRGTRVPTPQPITTKIANTVRGSLSPKGTDFWLRGSDTLFNLNNPNRLLPKSFNTLGLTDLGPPSMDITPQTRGLLPSGSIITPPPATPSGPVDLGAGGFQPLADNRQLPGAGRASGPQTQSGPSQFGISLPGETPRPLTGPERQIPAQTSPSNTSFPMERGGRGPNQVPPPIELGPSPLEPVPPRMPPKSSSGGNGSVVSEPNGSPQSIIESAGGVYWGKDEANGTIEIKLPPEMTKDLPIPDWQKRNISITMHEGDVTPENVKARIQAKYIQFGGKPK